MLATKLREVMTHRQACLSSADHYGFDVLHCGPLHAAGSMTARNVCCGLRFQLIDATHYAIARQLNERPRKTLNFETPAEQFSQSVASTG